MQCYIDIHILLEKLAGGMKERKWDTRSTFPVLCPKHSNKVHVLQRNADSLHDFMFVESN